MTLWANSGPKFKHLPNLISALRALLGLWLPVLILSPRSSMHFVACCVFAFAAITDRWDGLLARRLGVVSDSGRYVDPLADKVLMLGALASFAHLGYYSMIWVIPVFVREIVITFCRTGWLLEGKAIGAEKLGKFKFGLQVVAVSVSLIYRNTLNYYPEVPWMRSLMMFFVVASMLMTVLSGLTFFWGHRSLCATPYFAKYTSALGVGFLRPAPGTWGTLLAIPLIWLCQVSPWVYGGLFAALLVSGFWSVGRLGLKEHEDPSFVVVDETLGMMLGYAAMPWNFPAVIFAFAAFRIFDIFKPFPLRRLERLPGFWGILLDDLGAGVYTCILTHILFHP